MTMKVGNITVNMHVTSTRPVYKDGWKGQERCSFNEVPYWALYKKVANGESMYIGVFTLEDLNRFVSNRSVRPHKEVLDAYSRWSKHTRGRNGKYDIITMFTEYIPDYVKYNADHHCRYVRLSQAIDKCRKMLRHYDEYIEQIYVTDNTTSVVVYIGK